MSVLYENINNDERPECIIIKYINEKAFLRDWDLFSTCVLWPVKYPLSSVH